MSSFSWRPWFACGPAATPTGPSSLSVHTSSGSFTNGQVRLSYRLDVPAHSAPVGAVVFGHGSGMATFWPVALTRS
jgi:hypothetical protein